jgi:hypothetical protein
MNPSIMAPHSGCQRAHMTSESSLTAGTANPAEPLPGFRQRAGRVAGGSVLRDWLQDAGSLTSRLRAACGPGFKLELLGEAAEPLPGDDARKLLEGSEARARRVRMFCGDSLCVCATTLIPAVTLAGDPGWRRSATGRLATRCWSAAASSARRSSSPAPTRRTRCSPRRSKARISARRGSGHDVRVPPRRRAAADLRDVPAGPDPMRATLGARGPVRRLVSQLGNTRC